MNKREYCESRESIAYYSGLNGLEIKGIEHGAVKRSTAVKSTTPQTVKIAHFSGCMGIRFRLMNVLEWGFNYELHFQNNVNNERIQQ